MHKNLIWYAAVLLVVYFTLVFCEETANTENHTELDTPEDILRTIGQELVEVEGRTRRHRHHFWLRHMWPLAIAYWIKVKVIIVSFFVGSAIYVGFRYLLPQYHNHKCPEIVLDHPPPSFSHHDHIPYSLDHEHASHSIPYSSHYDAPTSFDSSSFEPYSAYGGYASGPDVHSEEPPAHGDRRRRGKRSSEIVEQQQKEEEETSRQMPAEEQIADFMFAFLGLDSQACRRRFVCEMEFRSKLNPLSSMAFRIVGRGFFEKYTNARNPEAQASSFLECAEVNPECIFMENEEPTEQEQEQVTEPVNLDTQNEINLLAERRHAKLKHGRGDRQLKPLAQHILTQ